jgi:50S ribosomal subunit-associated GTPase HflX
MGQQRAVLRKNRDRRHVPSVAVVGYTNSGKTSLIKALTGTTKLTPKNKLFATLDVTAHPTKLPSNVTVVFVDTVSSWQSDQGLML